MSEENIGEGKRRICAVTTNYAFKAIESGALLEKEINEASEADKNTLAETVPSLKNRVEKADIPAPIRAELRERVMTLDNEVRKAQKQIEQGNTEKAVKEVTEIAESTIKEGKHFVVASINVGMDAVAVREAVLKAKQKGISMLVFSRDKASNKVVGCAGVPTNASKKVPNAAEWLKAAMGPLKGKAGGKPDFAQGQGTDASQFEEALKIAERFATLKLAENS